MPADPATDAVTLGVAACAGRMGRAIMAAVIDAPGCVLGGASQYPGHPAVGSDAGGIAGLGSRDLRVSGDAGSMMAAVDVVIDFSTPQATCAHVASALDAQVPIVIGTTGLTPADQRAIDAAATAIPIVFAPNMSVGATLLMLLTERLAGVLDTDYDIEILGRQHRHKVDAPSGTALALARAAARGRGLPPGSVGAVPRDGHTGPRPAGLIGLATVQGGDVTGEHKAIFAAEGERLELGHKPADRRVYAAGAVRAAVWLHRRRPGLYTMAEVLGFAAPSAD